MKSHSAVHWVPTSHKQSKTTHPEPRCRSREPKGKQMLLILRNKSEMLKWSQALIILWTGLSLNKYAKKKATPWAWTKINVNTSWGLPMGYGPGFKSWDGMIMLKVSTGFPLWTWITWHFSWLIYCFSILELSYTSALFSRGVPGNFSQWPGLLWSWYGSSAQSKKVYLALVKQVNQQGSWCCWRKDMKATRNTISY